MSSDVCRRVFFLAGVSGVGTSFAAEAAAATGTSVNVAVDGLIAGCGPRLFDALDPFEAFETALPRNYGDRWSTPPQDVLTEADAAAARYAPVFAEHLSELADNRRPVIVEGYAVVHPEIRAAILRAVEIDGPPAEWRLGWLNPPADAVLVNRRHRAGFNDFAVDHKTVAGDLHAYGVRLFQQRRPLTGRAVECVTADHAVLAARAWCEHGLFTSLAFRS